MKALILANVGKEHFYQGEVLPSCFLPLYNEMTVLERQISLLNINHIDNEHICVVFGQDGIWDVKMVREKMKAIRTKKIFESKSDVLPEKIFEDIFFSDEGLIVLYGNHVFDISVLARILRFKKKNAIVVSSLLDPDETKQTISVEDGKVTAINNAEWIGFPWKHFSGVAKFSADMVKKLQTATRNSRPLLDALDDILAETDLWAIKYDDLVSGRINGAHSIELTGGSYSKLNYRLVVKKEDEGAGRDKLIKEINWLLALPPELKPYFSDVLEYDVDSTKVYYNVPYYGSRNLREHIMDGHFDADSAVKFLQGLLTWMFEHVYCRKVSDDTENWVMENHICRVLNRLPECARKSPELGRLIEAERIVINGTEYKNIRELFLKLSQQVDSGAFLESVRPSALVMIHGDLHFQNILVYPQTDTGFILVDPRGEKDGSDIYYDMGKLWHSFHGKYDFIHTDQFHYELEWEGEVPQARIEITNKYVEHVYDDIYTRMKQLLPQYDYFVQDKNWEMKTLFAEAAHFCSVAIFHIDKTRDSKRACVLYLRGVQLINDFFKQYLPKIY